MRLYQISKLIERGDVEAHAEWDQVSHAQPADFTVDAQRTSQTDRDNVRAGVESMPAVIRRNGRDAEDVLREQARYLKLRKKIAKAEGVPEIELGTLSLPGDQVAPASAPASGRSSADNPDDPDASPEGGGTETDDDSDAMALKDSEAQSAFLETYATGVRAGVLTPNLEDEKAIRAKLGLPAPSEAVAKAWDEDGGSRKPITLKSQNESVATTNSIDPGAQPAPAKNSETE
jgi:hypothetical protein